MNCRIPYKKSFMIEPKRTILIIDDESYIRKSTGSYLEDCGFVVIAAENGLSGLKKIRKEKFNG